MSDIPDHKIQRSSREEALVCGIVLLLATKVPGLECDAVYTTLAMLYLLAVCPVINDNSDRLS